jgi:hypothetical protein
MQYKGVSECKYWNVPWRTEAWIRVTRIISHPSATARDKAASPSLRSLTVLNVLSKYASAR